MIPAPRGRCFKSKIKRPAFNYPASFRTIFSSHTESADFVRPGRPSFLSGLSLFFRCCMGQLRFLCRAFSSMRQASYCLNCFRIIRNISLFLRQQVFSAVRLFYQNFLNEKRGGKPSLPPPAHIYERAAFICDRSLFGLQLIWQAECAEACA